VHPRQPSVPSSEGGGASFSCDVEREVWQMKSVISLLTSLACSADVAGRELG